MNEQEHLESKIILVDEEGNEENFEIVDVIEFEEMHYAILLPEKSEESDNAFVFRLEDEDGEDILCEIEDDDEWERVVEYWNLLIDEE